MPEGPSLYIWSTMAKQFLDRKITRICGSSKTVDKMKWSGATLEEVRVYGKRLFLHLAHRGGSTSSADPDEESVWIRCHFLMWGSVRVNEFNCKPSKTNRFPEPRLVFYFSKDEFLVFYGGSFQEMDQPPEDESRSDILSDAFDRSRAVDHLLEDHPISFTLLDQRKFTGLGNIIKNEVLFSTRTHPIQVGSQLSRAQAISIVDTIVTFSKRWLSWKMEEKPSTKFGDWTEIYKKAVCPSDHKTTRSMFGPTGMERITYWCPTCQPMNTQVDLPSEKGDGTHESNKDPESAHESSANSFSGTIPDSEHLMTTADENSMNNSAEGDQVMSLTTVLNVEDFKQEETPANSNEELQLVDSPVIQESHSSADNPRCCPKSKQTSVDPPHEVEMNGTSLSILSLKTELSNLAKSHGGKENSSPLSKEQPAGQCFHTTRKIKLESKETSNFDLSEVACENVSHLLPTTTSPSDGPPCNVKRIVVQDRRQCVEDSTRISVSVSTIKVLMRGHVRVNVKKLKLGKD